MGSKVKMAKNAAPDCGAETFTQKNKIDFNAFASLITEAKGKVSLITADGDCLIASSLLSSLIGLSTILSVSSVQDLVIRCENSEDCRNFRRFISRYRADAGSRVILAEAEAETGVETEAGAETHAEAKS